MMKLIDLTKDDLDLYRNDPDSTEAAQSISESLNFVAVKLCAWMRRNPDYREDLVGQYISYLYKRFVFPKLQSYKGCGASDPEPIHNTKISLINLVQKHYRIGGFTKLIDYF